MLTSDFHYDLPPELIAQMPTPERDRSRLMVLHRDGTPLEHWQFRNLPQYLRPGDVLVLNNSRVIPARLRGRKAGTGGEIEVLLIEENGVNDWWVMLRPGKRVRPGTYIQFVDVSGAPSTFGACVVAKNDEGHCRLRFEGGSNVGAALDRLGEVPLPPYIERLEGVRSEDRERYQTVFARTAGSVAAPTAGLHFTEALIQALRAQRVIVCYVTLHVGLGTFAPVKASRVAEHVMHEERFELSEETARAVNAAKREGRRVIAVGTTSVRVVESAARETGGDLLPVAGRTRIFIHPPFKFNVVDGLVTNFHLPESTLLMLVSAFASPGRTQGRELVLSAYAEAARERYRFFSYGDAMLVL